ncbi:hypothetical protein [Microlunatus parietis]|uniref:Uncharacterized protein n=1 Tax=Microlunatus parietis TaxID=682979 RepID=A0A7Y9LFE8_9ACTN|nr:hypothetical protein [Microlunatus parietis]NYE74895.1 hypothetical protein [Microlunatus parietis]
MITDPYRAGPAQTATADSGWSAVVVRLLWLTVLGQLLGYVLGALVGAGTGMFGRAPGLGLVVSVGAALVAGSAVGLAVTPGRCRLPALVVINVVLAAVVSSLLIMLAQARLPAGVDRPGPAGFAPTVLVTAFGQGLIGCLIWMARSRRRSRAAAR